jgi:hypothetical protein
MTDDSSTTFSKILAIAEAYPFQNMRAGRIQGTLSINVDYGGEGGVIGLGTA